MLSSLIEGSAIAFWQKKWTYDNEDRKNHLEEQSNKDYTCCPSRSFNGDIWGNWRRCFTSVDQMVLNSGSYKKQEQQWFAEQRSWSMLNWKNWQLLELLAWLRLSKSSWVVLEPNSVHKQKKDSIIKEIAHRRKYETPAIKTNSKLASTLSLPVWHTMHSRFGPRLLVQ